MIIQCKNINKNYFNFSEKHDVVASANVNLSISKGDFITILGHSGSGKTTLLSIIGGLTTPDSGEIFINNKLAWCSNDSESSKIRNKKIGFIFQFASLLPTLTSLENVLLPLNFIQSTSDRRNKTAYGLELLNKVGIGDKANYYPGQLSGGQQRRIAIARAFITSPDIILADEPTGDLDEETENEILSIFKEFNNMGTTFVVVTHNKDLPKTQTNPRILTMRNGILSEA